MTNCRQCGKQVDREHECNAWCDGFIHADLLCDVVSWPLAEDKLKVIEELQQLMTQDVCCSFGLQELVDLREAFEAPEKDGYPFVCIYYFRREESTIHG